MLTDADRNLFDTLLEKHLTALPERYATFLDEVPLVVEDRPSRELLDEMDMDDGDDLCGLHSGVPMTDRSVEDHATIPDQIMLFREPIFRMARLASRSRRARRDELDRQIRITLLHELGHHLGLDEDQLEELGYE
ncbi:MAG: metallopeptidase family protein [Phycisphaeraceae bacterium]